MATDLALTQSPQTPCSVLLSQNTALAKLVDETHPHFQRLINREERDQLAALIPAYEAALVPATPDYIGKSIGVLAVAFPGGKGSDDEAKIRLKLYRDGLADVPEDVLAAACRAAVRTCQFFPTVKDIRDRCGELQMRAFRLFRIKHLIAEHDRRWKAEQPAAPMSEADRAEYERIMKRMGAAA